MHRMPIEAKRGSRLHIAILTALLAMGLPAAACAGADGGDLRAVVGAADGHALRLHVQLHFEGSRASGTVAATPETG